MKKLNIVRNQKDGDKKAFNLLKEQILHKPDSLICLASGKTTDGLHELISKDCKKNPKNWEKISFIQLDENLGISSKSLFSFNHEISKELKDFFKVLDKKNIFLIDGKKLPKATIKEAYVFIKKRGGIDFMTLGIGPEYDPHIAYNTTGQSTITSKMRVIKIHPKIREKMLNQKKNCGRDLINQVSTKGLTLGVADILKAKKALLIAYGSDKAKSMKLAFSGKINMKKASASALQLHKDLEIIIDKDAASSFEC